MIKLGGPKRPVENLPHLTSILLEAEGCWFLSPLCESERMAEAVVDVELRCGDRLGAPFVALVPDQKCSPGLSASLEHLRLLANSPARRRGAQKKPHRLKP